MLYHVKSRTPDSSLTKACLEELIRQTEGVCGITGIALDMSMKGHSAPSLDRIDVKGGYEKENVWIVSFIGNRMKSVCSVKEAQEFIVEVVRICREKKLIV